MNTPNNVFRNNGARLPAGGSRKGRYAFTLVELLVVVAIIALLVSILLPSLGKAKEQARMVMCMSNLKGLGMGFAYYNNDNNDYYPKGIGYGTECGDTWDVNIQSYYGNYGLLHCPSDKLPRTWDAVWWDEDKRYPRSYAGNFLHVLVTGPSTAKPDYSPHWCKTSSIEIPGETLLLSEMWEAAYWGTTYVPGRYGQYHASLTFTNYWTSIKRLPTRDVHGNKDRANYIFCDQHVTSLQADDPKINEDPDFSGGGIYVYYLMRNK